MGRQKPGGSPAWESAARGREQGTAVPANLWPALLAQAREHHALAGNAGAGPDHRAEADSTDAAPTTGPRQTAGRRRARAGRTSSGAGL
jgi:hypothetical protein